MDRTHIPPDDSDEPLTPPRSPSRLDFCTQGMDWADFGGYTFVDQDAFPLDVVHSHSPRFPLVEDGEDNSFPAIDPQAPQNRDTSHELLDQQDFASRQVIIIPQAPIPVRPLPVEFPDDLQEHVRPSCISPQRHSYPHHGFSRSALFQQKSFWNLRYEEWLEWEARMEEDRAEKRMTDANDAYAGLAAPTAPRPRVAKHVPPYMRTPPSGLERDLADQPLRKPEQDVHASIYPRVGDISALRDPYSVRIDRCFFKYPLWTLHKALYAFNMHQQAVRSAYDPTSVETSRSSSTLSSYTSSTADDDESDLTLIADDSPTHKNRAEASKDISSVHSMPTWNRFYGWGLSWYARWQLLVGLFQCDTAKHDTSYISATVVVPPKPEESPPLPPRRPACFTVEVDEDEQDEEDEDDYGTLISKSSFGLDFDEECARAMAFYGRESTPPEVVIL